MKHLITCIVILLEKYVKLMWFFRTIKKEYRSYNFSKETEDIYPRQQSPPVSDGGENGCLRVGAGHRHRRGRGEQEEEAGRVRQLRGARADSCFKVGYYHFYIFKIELVHQMESKLLDSIIG